MFGFIKRNLLDVIEWTDSTRDTLVYRFPMMEHNGKQKEIMMGAKLTVRESQAAVFVSNGKIADVFAPGMHTLSTSNLPILTEISSWAFGFNSPFKAEVYFVNTRQFTDMKWGTANPVMMRDSEFGMVRLRAFGNFSFRIDEPGVFVKEISGTSGILKLDDFVEQLKRQVISSFSDLMGESKIPALDIAQNYEEIAQLVADKVQTRFNQFGTKVTSVVVENISLPKEVETAMDKRTSMGVLGNLDQYAKYQTAEAIRDAANNPSGGANFAGIGVGLGAGGAMGAMMGQSLQPSQVLCPACKTPNVQSAKFCSNCGASMTPVPTACPQCKQPIAPGTKFCPHCGQKIA